MTTVFLQGQSQLQNSREYVFDDPFAPLRLPRLAQISEFWRRYDRLADIHDKKLTTNLNGNLDVLLIFAALFSAINTTFISVTMPDLSPNPSDETNNLLRLLVMGADNNTLTPSDLVPPFSPTSNSVVVNCLLYASLSCSLLAAIGAMMAKEWLQSFDRTGQTGPLEEQALFRQRKFNGVLEWHLEAVIKFLPNLLLLSVILFFVGISLFLFPINTAVAGVVIAFSGIGVVFSGTVIVAGAISPTCPYQSAASSALRRGYRGLVESWRLAKRTLIRPAASRTPEVAQKFWKSIHRWLGLPMDRVTMLVSRVKLWYHGSSGPNDSAGQQPLNQDPAPSSPVFSDLGSPPIIVITPPPPAITEPEQAEGRDLSGAIQTHPSVRWFPTGVWQAIERMKRRWERLSRMHAFSSLHRSPAAAPTNANSDHILTVQAARWLLETTSNRGDQISTAQFICSLDRATCTEVFEDHESWKRLLNLTLGAFEIWSSQPNKENQEVGELFGLVLCRVLLQCSQGGDKWRDITNESSRRRSQTVKTFLQTLVIASSEYSSHDPEDYQRILHISVIFTALKTWISLGEFQWTNPSCLLNGRSAAAASLLAVWAPLLWTIGTGRNATVGLPSKGITELWLREQELADNLNGALAKSLECFQLIQGDLGSALAAAQGYTVCLQRVRELCQPSSWLLPGRLHGLADLMWSYIDPLTASGSADTRLLRLSVEVLLTFKTFLPSHSSGSATSKTSSDTLIESSKLIDTVVGILLDDLTSLTSQNEKWRSRGRTFKACVIRVFLWIWRNHPTRNAESWGRRKLFTSSCRLWAPLEKEVAFSKTGSFNSEDKPLTPEDLKGVVEFAEWVQTHSQNHGSWYSRRVTKCSFITCNADVEINRLYAHFARRPDWEYRLYDLHEDGGSCPRSIYGEDGCCRRFDMVVAI